MEIAVHPSRLRSLLRAKSVLQGWICANVGYEWSREGGHNIGPCPLDVRLGVRAWSSATPPTASSPRETAASRQGPMTLTSARVNIGSHGDFNASGMCKVLEEETKSMHRLEEHRRSWLIVV